MPLTQHAAWAELAEEGLYCTDNKTPGHTTAEDENRYERANEAKQSVDDVLQNWSESARNACLNRGILSRRLEKIYQEARQDGELRRRRRMLRIHEAAD